jgi:hypothetical protein
MSPDDCAQAALCDIDEPGWRSGASAARWQDSALRSTDATAVRWWRRHGDVDRETALAEFICKGGDRQEGTMWDVFISPRMGGQS